MKKILIVLTSIFLAFSLIGCASSRSVKSETVTTRTQVDSGGNGGNYVAGQSSNDNDPEIVEYREVREKETVHDHPGVLGSTLHLIGKILAFPFKVVAGAIEFIF